MRTAESVLLPGGKGVLAQAAPGSGTSGSGAAGSTIYLISPQGVRYPLGSVETLAALGYEGVAPLAVPGSLLALIPTGPTLDRADALVHFSPGAAAAATPVPQSTSAAPATGTPASGRHRWRCARGIDARRRLSVSDGSPPVAKVD